jgi:hypothetical protein
MKPGQFQFTWPVHGDHGWIEGKLLNDVLSGIRSKPDAYLVPFTGTGARLVKPLEATGLFRDFAQLEKTETAMLTFANDYGMLAAGSDVILVSPPHFAQHSIATYTRVREKQSLKIIPLAESSDFWANQINAMHRAVQLWDAVSSTDPQRELRRFIEWPDKTCVRYRSGSKASGDWMEEWIAATVHFPELLARLEYPDLVQPAWRQLQRLVNRHLVEFAPCPQLLWDNGKLPLFTQPQNLIGGMWLQFARAIGGDRQYRTCPGCGHWFEVGGGRKRSDAQTCSPTCRQRKNRNPVGRARTRKR